MADERDARRKLQPTRRSDSGRAHRASSTPRASRVETTRETSDAVRARIEARRAARQGAQASQERPSQARHVTSPSRTRAERPQGVDGGRRRAEKAGPSPAERAAGLAAVFAMLPVAQSLMLAFADARVDNAGTPVRSTKITRSE